MKNQKPTTSGPVALAAAAALMLGIAACQKPAPAPEPEPVRVESGGLQIAIVALPAPFEVASNEGETLVLATPDGGELTIAMGPERTAGINLVREIKERKSYFEELPEGRFFGNQELVTPIGSAFSARGSYRAEDGAGIEETWIYALHPGANRLLSLVYRYPPGEDSGARVGELVSVLGEIEPW